MQIQKHYRIAGTISDVQHFLIDLHQYGRIHPLINGIEKIDSSTSEIANYKITERPFNWLPINIQYFASVKSNENAVDYEITGIPFTQGWIHYDLTSLKDEIVEISFNLKITGNWPGKKLLKQKMVKAQDHLMEAIKKELQEV